MRNSNVVHLPSEALLAHRHHRCLQHTCHRSCAPLWAYSGRDLHLLPQQTTSLFVSFSELRPACPAQTQSSVRLRSVFVNGLDSAISQTGVFSSECFHPFRKVGHNLVQRHSLGLEDLRLRTLQTDHGAQRSQRSSLFAFNYHFVHRTQLLFQDVT